MHAHVLRVGQPHRQQHERRLQLGQHSFERVGHLRPRSRSARPAGGRARGTRRGGAGIAPSRASARSSSARRAATTSSPGPKPESCAHQLGGSRISAGNPQNTVTTVVPGCAVRNCPQLSTASSRCGDSTTTRSSSLGSTHPNVDIGLGPVAMLNVSSRQVQDAVADDGALDLGGAARDATPPSTRATAAATAPSPGRRGRPRRARWPTGAGSCPSTPASPSSTPGPGSTPRPSRDSVRQLCSRSRRSSTKACASPSDTSTSSSRPRSAASPPQLVEVALVHHLFLEREAGAPLVGQRRVGHRPAVSELPHQVVRRHEHLVEEHLVELRLAGDLAQGAHGHARRLHVDHDIGDAPVTRARRDRCARGRSPTAPARA